MDILRYFMAICEEDQNGNTVYPLYFINNSLEEIEVLMFIKPRAMEKLKSIKKIEDIKDDFIDSVCVRKCVGIPSKSYIRDTIFFDWDFDWSNERWIWIRAPGGEEHLHFYMERYFIAFNKEVDFIPVLNRKGWIVL